MTNFRFTYDEIEQNIREDEAFADSLQSNFNSLIEISIQWGRVPVMVQEFLPAAKEADKRVILLDEGRLPGQKLDSEE